MSLPPPRPKTTAAPPRPKTHAETIPAASVPRRGKTEAQKLLEGLLEAQEESNSPKRVFDASTGFGEWSVIPENVDSSFGNSEGPDVFPRAGTKELKRPIMRENENVSFTRKVTKKNRRTTREDDDY
jgi:hypothetical protein